MTTVSPRIKAEDETMLCRIDGRNVQAKVIERGSSTAPGCSNRRFPILVEHEDREVWVYQDEINCRTIAGDKGPVRPHSD